MRNSRGMCLLVQGAIVGLMVAPATGGAASVSLPSRAILPAVPAVPAPATPVPHPPAPQSPAAPLPPIPAVHLSPPAAVPQRLQAPVPTPSPPAALSHQTPSASARRALPAPVLASEGAAAARQSVAGGGHTPSVGRPALRSFPAGARGASPAKSNRGSDLHGFPSDNQLAPGERRATQRLRQAVSRLRGCVSALPAPLQTLIKLRTGLGQAQVMTRAQSAALLKISVRRIPRLERVALRRLDAAARQGGCAARAPFNSTVQPGAAGGALPAGTWTAPLLPTVAGTTPPLTATVTSTEIAPASARQGVQAYTGTEGVGGGSLGKHGSNLSWILIPLLASSVAIAFGLWRRHARSSELGRQ
jgi:hypothetical protein